MKYKKHATKNKYLKRAINKLRAIDRRECWMIGIRRIANISAGFISMRMEQDGFMKEVIIKK